MGKSVVFEVATFADAIQKANRVAPNKGAAFDKAAGIVIEVDPLNIGNECIVKSTDTEVTLRMELSVIRCGDEPVRWRVPAKLIHGLTSNLPLGSGNEIELVDQDDGNLYFRCGKTKASLRQITGGYPAIDKFDSSDMGIAPNLSARLAQVAWATDKRGTGVLSGVHIDGNYLYGCNRANMAMVPCTVTLDAPVTAPLSEVASIIRNTNEVALRATDTKLMLMPDDHTQATCVLYMDPYPDIAALMKRIAPKFEVALPVETIVAAIERTLVLMKDERLPSSNIEIGDGVIKMTMITDAGVVVDEIEVVGGSSDPFKVAFNPEAFREAVKASGRATVDLQYGPTTREPMLLVDDNEYKALVMPMRAS